MENSYRPADGNEEGSECTMVQNRLGVSYVAKTQVYQHKVGGLTVKAVSDTRWQSHIEAIRAIRFQAPNIQEALLYLSESSEFTAETRAEASSLLEDEFENFEFIVGMVVWHHLLLVVKSVNQAISPLTSRFEQFQEFAEKFGFLYNVDQLCSLDDDILMASCINLENHLEHCMSSDINGHDLYAKLKVLQSYLLVETGKAIELLNFLKDMEGCYPNAFIAYRILLTIPVTIASAERNFSKLKLIKNYLRSTMSQEMLNGLAMLSIEIEILNNIDFDSIIKDFTSETAGISIIIMR
ncbi:uncharacterized protein LOC113312709 [Papaver somniferum]|uniref:uncharacterized protein LOC113312709 n=1 Tax=Papaver somniferum TaxID=3469 RepID=UPI000E6FBE17|nr:uncharacterized protein LOC113312709 [Papaver somniferum]